MGTNRRYGDQLTQRSTERWANGGRRPFDLPRDAHGPQRFEWEKPGRPVWAWIYWDDGSCERLATRATRWNDRVVEVVVPGGFAFVWRNAVTVRQ